MCKAFFKGLSDDDYLQLDNNLLAHQKLARDFNAIEDDEIKDFIWMELEELRQERLALLK